MSFGAAQATTGLKQTTVTTGSTVVRAPTTRSSTVHRLFPGEFGDVRPKTATTRSSSGASRIFRVCLMGSRFGYLAMTVATASRAGACW